MSHAAALASVLGSSGNLLLDTLLDGRAGTLPMRPPAVHRPDFLNALLAGHGTDAGRRAARAAQVRVLDVRPPSSNCSNHLLEIDWEGGPTMPRTLFLKLPGEPLGTRWFCNAIRVWELECEFFRRFAGDFPLRLPAVHAVATHRSRFALLQENLAADPSVRLFTNRDMLCGPPPELLHDCLRAFATVHAHFHGWSAAAREQRLPMARHPFLSPVMGSISPVINRAAVAPCARKAPALFGPRQAARFRAAMDRWDALCRWWYREPLTLVHGDSHIGNLFAHAGGIGMLDFQAPHWSKGLRDVNYFLVNSLPVDVLAAQERGLVAFYVDALAERGVQLDAGEAWEQYRAFSFQTLMTIVTSLGLGPLTEGDAVMREVLARAVAAVERLEFHEWLDTLA